MDGGGVEHDGEWAPDKGFEKLIAQREAKKAAGATGAVTARKPEVGASDVRRKREAPRVAKTDGRRKRDRRDKQLNLKVLKSVREEFYALAQAQGVSGGELVEQMIAAWKTVHEHGGR